MVKKIIGYLLAAVGIAGLIASSIPKIWAKLPIPSDIAKTLTISTAFIISIALIILGLFFLKGKGKGGGFSFGKSKQKMSEVPIYHGDQVVGFRRIGQK